MIDEIPIGDIIVGGAVYKSLTSSEDLFILARVFGPIAYAYLLFTQVQSDEIPAVLQFTKRASGDNAFSEPLLSYNALVVAVASAAPVYPCTSFEETGCIVSVLIR